MNDGAGVVGVGESRLVIAELASEEGILQL